MIFDKRQLLFYALSVIYKNTHLLCVELKLVYYSIAFFYCSQQFVFFFFFYKYQMRRSINVYHVNYFKKSWHRANDWLVLKERDLQKYLHQGSFPLGKFLFRTPPHSQTSILIYGLIIVCNSKYDLF